MARLQPGSEQPFPTVWDDAGREVLDHAPPFLALADSTFQGLLRIQGANGHPTVFRPWVLPPSARDLP